MLFISNSFLSFCDNIELLTYVEVDMECYFIERRGAEVNMIKFTVQ